MAVYKQEGNICTEGSGYRYTEQRLDGEFGLHMILQAFLE